MSLTISFLDFSFEATLFSRVSNHVWISVIFQVSRDFCHFYVSGVFRSIFRFNEYFGQFLCFGGILVIFLDFRVILVNLFCFGGISIIFFLRFRGYFGNFQASRVGYFGHFLGFEDILVIFLGFEDILIIFSDLFQHIWSFLGLGGILVNLKDLMSTLVIFKFYWHFFLKKKKKKKFLLAFQ